MVHTFKPDQFTRSTSGTFVTEASDLGLKPGEYVGRFQLDEPDRDCPATFLFTHVDRCGGEVVGRNYRDELGRLALIIND